jgi:hypothetical protein
MPRYIPFLLALATLSATSVAQNANQAVPGNSPTTQSQPAPIERVAPPNNWNGPNPNNRPQTVVTRPAQGILVRADQNSSVRTVSADASHTELSVEHGRVNLNVHSPANGVQILVDLPGGQTALLKDGLYTFNADTKTVRVLKGEAMAFPGPDEKGIKVKEDHQLVFGATPVRSVEVDPFQARADLLPGNYVHNPERHYGNGFYGDDYGYPYYGYGDPYGYWGYPYGYGYPFGFGLGFGYYGGYRGGFGGGFGGFHGHRYVSVVP